MSKSSRRLCLRLSESEYLCLEREAARSNQRLTARAKQKLCKDDYPSRDQIEKFVRALDAIATAAWEIERQISPDDPLFQEALASLEDIERQLVALRQQVLGK